ncbi:MAG: tRNA (adenosine(37)-N6)-threonylcarbamoyltransferase complex ATPase subunit type 1 TsaE [bacterium]
MIKSHVGYRLFVKSPSEMMRIAKQIARLIPTGTKIGLIGELGAGKTTFVKGFASAYNIHKDIVTSPTFTLINEYKGSVTIYHADLYRIRSENELEGIGIHDLDTDKGFLLIEWPEKFKSLANSLDLFLVFSMKDNGREIRLNGKKKILDKIGTLEIFKRGKKYGFSG